MKCALEAMAEVEVLKKEDAIREARMLAIREEKEKQAFLESIENSYPLCDEIIEKVIKNRGIAKFEFEKSDVKGLFHYVTTWKAKKYNKLIWLDDNYYNIDDIKRLLEKNCYKVEIDNYRKNSCVYKGDYNNIGPVYITCLIISIDTPKCI